MRGMGNGRGAAQPSSRSALGMLSALRNSETATQDPAGAKQLYSAAQAFPKTAGHSNKRGPGYDTGALAKLSAAMGSNRNRPLDPPDGTTDPSSIDGEPEPNHGKSYFVAPMPALPYQGSI